MVRTLVRRVSTSGVVIGIAAGLGGWGGESAVHAIGANHHYGWRALEYVAGTGGGVAIGGGAAFVSVLGYFGARALYRGMKRVAKEIE